MSEDNSLLLLEGLPDDIARNLSGLVDDIIAIVLERELASFLKAHHVPVDGTEESVVAFEFDGPSFGVAFDAEFGSAMRTMGFEHPWRGDRVGHENRS
jgi:hypothetical protein